VVLKKEKIGPAQFEENNKSYALHELTFVFIPLAITEPIGQPEENWKYLFRNILW
jgi:hypothetical protein